MEITSNLQSMHSQHHAYNVFTKRKRKWPATLYTTRQLKIGAGSQLDKLAREAGLIYSQTVVTFWRIVRRNGVWLSSNSMQKLVHSESLHSQTVQGIVQTFYEALKSWESLRKAEPNARPPRRLNRYYAVPFKSSAITLKGGILSLSTGKKNEPLLIPWPYFRPKMCEITYNGEEYVLNAVYAISEMKETTRTGCAGVDLGEVHVAAVNTGERTIIINGRELRSKRRYQDRAKAHFRSVLGKCKKHSRKWKRISKVGTRTLSKVDNQIRDILHKQTTALVCAIKEDDVQTVGIGNMRDMRKNETGMPTGRIKAMIKYKAERVGMTVELVSERDTSRICPKCGTSNKTKDRNYLCGHCGFRYHRDGIGAINIRSRTLYREITPVVGDMTPPVGIRYYTDSSRKSATIVA